jgi:hypothetical protein
LKPTPTPVTFSGDERIELKDCYVFRDGYARKAIVAIASAVSFTDLPHLFHIDVIVPGSKKMTLGIGIPFPEVMRMLRHNLLWNDSLSEYDACKLDVVGELFDKCVADLTSIAWTEDDFQTIRDMDATDEMHEIVKNDLLKIAAVALEKHDV